MRQTSDVDSRCVVSVTAQVMKRDDLFGYWMPHEQGGYSNIQLRKFCAKNSSSSLNESEHSSSNSQNCCDDFLRYQIVGEKLVEKVLDCPLRLGVLYERPTPTFHHWSYGEERYGLTFISPGDARLFYNAINKALQHLAGEIDCPFPSATVPEATAVDCVVKRCLSEQLQPTVESLRTVSPDTSTDSSIEKHNYTPPLPPKPLHLSNESPPVTQNLSDEEESKQEVWILRDDLQPPPLYPRRDKEIKSLRHSKPLPVPSETDKRRLNEYAYVDLVPKAKSSFAFNELNNTKMKRQQSAVSEGELSATSCTRLLNSESVLQEVMLPYKRPVCQRCSGRVPHERSLQCLCCGQEPRLYSNPQPKGPHACTCSSRRPAMRRTLDALLVLLTCVWCKRERPTVERHDSSKYNDNAASKQSSADTW